MIVRLLIIVSCVASSGYAQKNYPPDFPDSAAHVYKKVDDIGLKLWVFNPADHDPENDSRPAIVFFFGGGWRSGTPAQFEPYCRYLASRGMVAATADYRVANRHGVKADKCVEDAKSAVRWLRQNAGRLGIDPDRIAAGGGSAGGHIACCTAYVSGMDAADEDESVSSVPNALALFNPAVMLAELDDFARSGISAEKIADIATRTGVPPVQISPIHQIRSGMPKTIIFHGQADPTVPYATVREFTVRTTAIGNLCELSGFPGAAHGFFNARKGKAGEKQERSQQWHLRTVVQLDRFLHGMGWLRGKPTIRIVDQDFVTLRGHVQNSLHRFENQEEGHVAFLGGSITEMKGYRPMIADRLQKRFPKTRFKFTNAGIASTCSTTGAFRLQRDVLDHGPVDLLFVEYAVNDDQDAAHSADDCTRGMEGIIRHVRHHNPFADIVMTHFVNEGMLDTLFEGKSILSASQHEAVARHYGVSSVYLSREVAAQIADGRTTWEEYGGTHPGPIGNRLAADQALLSLEAGWDDVDPSNVKRIEHELPARPLLASSYTTGRLLPLQAIEDNHGWEVSEPDWKRIPGSKRSRFKGIPLLHSEKPGATLEFTFNGTAVGAYLLAGPDAGRLDVQIDDGKSLIVDLYHKFSKGLHYPRTVMFARDLKESEHRVKVKLVETQTSAGARSAARILHFVVNSSGE